MNKTVFSVIIAILIAMTLSAQNIGTKTLSTDVFAIEYPANWVLEHPGQMNTTFMMFAPTLRNDTFSENISLIVQNLNDRKLDLDSFVLLSENQINTMVVNGKLIASQRLKTDRHSHHVLIYTGDRQGFNLKFVQYYWLIDHKAYVLTFTAEEKEFPRYQDLAEKVMNSFVLKIG